MARPGFTAKEFQAATGRCLTRVSKQLPKAFAWLLVNLQKDPAAAIEQIVRADQGVRDVHPHAVTCALCMRYDGIKSLIELIEAQNRVESSSRDAA